MQRLANGERRRAQMVASMIKRHRDLWQRAGRAKGGTERDWERFYEQQSDRENLIGFYICNFAAGNPARFLQLVAHAIDGKVQGAPHDDVILEAAKEVMERRLKKKTGRSLRFGERNPLCPFPEVDAEYLKLTKGIPNRMSDRHVRRRWEAIIADGRLFSDRPARHKRKPRGNKERK